MPDTESLLVFFGICVLLALSPGPDILFVVAQSMSLGARAGLLVTLGLCTGLLGHTSLVALGVSALLKASPVLFTALKWAGASYLVYLAVQSYQSSAAKLGRSVRLTSARLYLRGIVLNLTNPKVSLFFVAFLPQFAVENAGPMWIQLSLLGALFILSTLLVFGGAALLSGSLGRWIGRNERVQTWLHRGAACIFLALAFKLLL